MLKLLFILILVLRTNNLVHGFIISNTKECHKSWLIKRSFDSIIDHNFKFSRFSATSSTTETSLNQTATEIMNSHEKNLIKKKNINYGGSSITAMDPDKVLTVKDLESILQQLNMNMNNTTTPIKTKRNKEGVAFPQSSVISYRDVRSGSIVISAIMYTILGLSISPNLWLMGMCFGIWYGGIIKIGEDESNYPLSSFIVSMGRRFAKYYLFVVDTIQTIFFLYKTGQLSYEYYKTYNKIDEKYFISDKIDSWNLRFQRGKRQFDEWEKKNEVGRKLLAGLRTVWFVEESSYKKFQKKINVRARLFFTALWNTVTFQEGDRLSLEDLSQRIGSGLTAIIAVNFLGVLFTDSPTFLALLTFFLGMLYPGWLKGKYHFPPKFESTSNIYFGFLCLC